MNFYCLHQGYYEGVQQRIDQLQDACQKQSIKFIALNSLEVDYSNLPTLSKTDLLYNATRGSETLESLLLNNDVTTFYIKTPDYVVNNPDTTKYTIPHTKANLPQPNTIFGITANRELLKRYVEFVGGFPLILKATGSTRGIGTIKIETWQNLISTVDYLVNTNAGFIIREFIKANGVGRCRVLGNQVIQTFEYPLVENDFRNAAVPMEQLPIAKQMDFTDEVKNDCIKACHIANTEFGSVDVLINEVGKHFILEVNFPSGLPINWQANNNFLAMQMITYLKNKSNG